MTSEPGPSEPPQPAGQAPAAGNAAGDAAAGPAPDGPRASELAGETAAGPAPYELPAGEPAGAALADAAAAGPAPNAAAAGEPPAKGLFAGIPAQVWAGTFLVALAGVCLEVALVRIFSLLFRYHHLFLLISVAICGLGVGGLIRTYLPERWCRLWSSAWLFGLSIPAVLLLLFRSPLAAHLVDTAWLPMVPMVPFVFAGIFLSQVFRRHAAAGGALYFADLSGAALAALAVVPLLQWLGGMGVCLLLATLLCAGAAILARDAGRPAVAACAAGALLCAGLFAVNPRLRLVDLPPLPAGVDDSMAKPLLRDTAPGSPEQIIATRWSAFARTDMTADRRDADTYFVYTDGDTPTNMIRFDGDLRKVNSLGAAQIGFLPYLLGRPQSVLCIGPGGGMDVLLGLLGHAKRIVGAEINGDTLALMEQYRAFNGSLYHHPGVEIHLADGRSFTARSHEKFDLIYSALTQSATGARAGIALAESYIHTREAFSVYLDHLSANGTLALVVQEDPLQARAFATAVAVLTSRGESIPEACRHLVAAKIPTDRFRFTPYRRILLVRQKAFTPAEAQNAIRTMARMGLNPEFVPYVLDSFPPYAGLAQGKRTLPEFVSDYGDATGANVTPRTDDQPFFVDLSWVMPPGLIALLRGMALATIAAALWLGLRRLRLLGGPDFGAALRGVGAAGYFALLGMGFMLLEVPLMQQFILFLGHPIRAVALVLFALLLGTAAGSRTSQRWRVASLPARVAVAALLAAGLALVYRAGLPAVFHAWLGWTLAGRMAVSVALLLPLGFLLGVPFPSGIRWAERDDPDAVPWLWGMNGLASVLGSVLSMALAWKIGYSAALLAGAGAYVLAASVAAGAKLVRLPRK